jgi:hypothetical protein
MPSIADEVHLPSVRIRNEETIIHPGEYRALIHPGDECHKRHIGSSLVGHHHQR